MISSIDNRHKKHADINPDVIDWCCEQLTIIKDKSTKSVSLQTAPSINGLVLCGGRSSRMGIDKGEIYYYNKTQREHVYELLSGLCNETFISCNQEQAKAVSHLPILKDCIPNLGPVSGILSAFQHNPNTAWLTLACDLPYLDAYTLQYLIRHRNTNKIATAFWDAQGKLPEPLITIWEPQAFPVLLKFVSDGYTCPRKVLINSDVEMLTAPDTSVFANINTTEDYEKAKQKINRNMIVQ